MKHITFNRVLFAIVLAYFPIAAIGDSGSIWRGVHSLCLLLVTMRLGADEGRYQASRTAAPTPSEKSQ